MCVDGYNIAAFVPCRKQEALFYIDKKQERENRTPFVFYPFQFVQGQGTPPTGGDVAAHRKNVITLIVADDKYMLESRARNRWGCSRPAFGCFATPPNVCGVDPKLSNDAQWRDACVLQQPASIPGDSLAIWVTLRTKNVIRCHPAFFLCGASAMYCGIVYSF